MVGLRWRTWSPSVSQRFPGPCPRSPQSKTSTHRASDPRQLRPRPVSSVFPSKIDIMAIFEFHSLHLGPLLHLLHTGQSRKILTLNKLQILGQRFNLRIQKRGSQGRVPLRFKHVHLVFGGSQLMRPRDRSRKKRSFVANSSGPMSREPCQI
ncbi:hypothetical protein PIB30_034130 [Stylosanthes scabra]|uniref:Uncharacterized protein n=1 Tax=Stylosanthes scabra TaxID=79078 RepID=A0ABU6TCG3_9FABA|nr:hypothetical protein [Stylosanthes scabra]